MPPLLPAHDFGYLLSQRGMFSYTGLRAAQVDQLRTRHAVYLLRSGRVCIAGLNNANVGRTAEAIATVLVGGVGDGLADGLGDGLADGLAD